MTKPDRQDRRERRERSTALCLLLLLPLLPLLPLLAMGLGAQKKKKLPRWKIDPYTRNDPEAMAKAGYVSFGPFPFGDHGSKVTTTTAIDKHLFYANIRWVETRHFRIGSTLDWYTIPIEPTIKAKIRAELTRLKKVLPRVNPRVRRLHPWLRVHLFAMRMEDLYTEFMDWLGVKDEDFPKDDKSWILGQKYMGSGPYLGMAEKYPLLVTEKGSTYFDYLKTYTGRQSKFGQRWHYMIQGSLFYGVGSDMYDGLLKHDTALHNDLVFNVTINMTDGFRHYSYDLPVWIREGLGHFFERRVCPKYNTFDQDEASPVDMRPLWRWKPYARKLVMGSRWSKFSTVIGWRQYSDINFNDHVMIWARTDFLMSQGKEKFKKFMFTIKGRVKADGLPNQKDLIGAVREGLKKAYNLTPLNIDEKFKAWVIENYPIR